MAEGRVLHPPPYLIQAAVREAHKLEGVGDPDRMVEAAVEPGA
jgi:hypothetical protein